MQYLNTFKSALAGGLKRVASYLQLAISEFLDDNGSHLSASMSYYLLFSFIPLLMAFLAILPSALGLEANVKEWFLRNFLDTPQTRDAINLIFDNVKRVQASNTVLAVLGLLWGGSAIFNVIRKTLNIIWGITIPRPFFRERLMEAIMVAVVGALMLVSLWLTIGINFISNYSELTGFADTINQGILGYLFPGTIMFLIFMFLYRFAPYVKLRWKDVWIEALIVAVVFEAIKNLFIFYVGNFETDNFLGSTLGAVFATLLWAYISSVVFLFGAEVASLRFRGVTIWGRGPIEAQEGPVPTFIQELKDQKKNAMENQDQELLDHTDADKSQ